ncbi:MAG TPA: hypothetical protein VJ843_03905 [Candidatus Saccharimonadales bacterium]|nr:hypothetical protein [Candidatus Saccharimonadales bacterium]
MHNGTLSAAAVCNGLMAIGLVLMLISAFFLRSWQAWHRGMVFGTCLVLPNTVRMTLQTHGTLQAVFFFGCIGLVLLIAFGDKLHR